MATQNMQAMQLLAPDISQEQNQLLRRQQMADLLRKQSLDPVGNTEMVGGWAVKKSPFEGLSKIAQALGANYIQDKTDSRQLELAKALQGRLGSIASGGGAGLSSDDAATASLATNSAGPTNANAATQDKLMEPVAASGNNKYNNKNLLQSLAINALGGNQASGAFWDDQKKTEGQKTNEYLGIGTPQAKSYELAKRLKDGTLTSLPGQVNDLPDGRRIVAPNFETGIAGGFNAQGLPIATEVQGSKEIAAARASGIKRAEAEIADQFAPPTAVDAAGGRTALTPAQQRTIAYGGIDPAYPNAAPKATPAPSMFQAPRPVSKNPLAQQEADADQKQIFQSEMNSARSRLVSSKTPEERQRAQAEIENLNRETKTLGIKLQDDSSRKFGEQVANKSADALLESRDKSKAASDSLMGIQKAREAIAGGVYQGSGAETKLAISKFFNANIPGVNIDPAKVTNTDYLKSTLGAGLLAEAKTLGTNPSNADATRINDIVGSITKDPGAMAKILDWRQEMAERSITNHNKTVDDAERRGMTSPYDLRVQGVQTAPSAPPAVPKPNVTLPNLPNPADHSGRRMRTPDGSVIRSNGKTWVKE